jgi:hypothetical protein
MTDAPEKIWAGGREPEWFFNDPSDHRDGGYKEYTRTDIAQARIAQLEEALRFYAISAFNPNDGPWGVESDDYGHIACMALGETT